MTPVARPTINSIFPVEILNSKNYQKNFDIIVDCIGVKNFYGLANPNIKLLEQARTYYSEFIEYFSKCNSIIYFISSGGSIYGDFNKHAVSETNSLLGSTPYANANIEIEKIIQTSENSIILRASNIFGEIKRNKFKQGLVTELFYAAINGSTISIDSLETVRDYIYIEDFINILIKLFLIDKKSGLYNIGTGIGTKTRDLIDLVADMVSKEGLILNPPQVPSSTVNKVNVLDNTKILNEIGSYEFLPLPNALEVTWDQIKSKNKK